MRPRAARMVWMVSMGPVARALVAPAAYTCRPAIANVTRRAHFVPLSNLDSAPMRFIALLLAASLLSSPRIARAQWRPQPSGTDAEFRGLSVVSRTVAWASGARGRSGTRLAGDGIPPALQDGAAFAASGSCLTVQGPTNVWIGTGGGAKARVYRSTDRGRTWSVAETPVHAGGASSGIFSVAFRDARHGIAVGGDYRQATGSVPNVALTDDGGETWRLAQGAPPNADLSAVSDVPNSTLV